MTFQRVYALVLWLSATCSLFGGTRIQSDSTVRSGRRIIQGLFKEHTGIAQFSGSLFNPQEVEKSHPTWWPGTLSKLLLRGMLMSVQP